MNTNRVTLAQLDKMPILEAARLPVEQIAMLLEEVAGQKSFAKRLDEKISAALDNRYGEKADEARRAEGKDTGRVRLVDDEYIVIADLPKKPMWNQTKLQQAVETVRSWGENVSDYVAIEMKVPESRFVAWPETIKKVFEPARTLGTGKPTFKIERKGDA